MLSKKTHLCKNYRKKKKKKNKKKKKKEKKKKNKNKKYDIKYLEYEIK